ncbi:MAG TPA: response regulator [Phenylobacterium sp.]
MQSGLRVLVVDDHPINRLVMTELFTQLGCAVTEAEDGEQALSMSSAETFDLICLDRHMPGLSGDEVLSRLPDEQFVMAWSTDLCDLPERFNGVLAKPITLASAQAALEKAVARRAAQAPRFPRLRRTG